MIVLIFETFPVTSSFTPLQRWRCFYSKVDIKHLFSQLEKRRTMYTVEWKIILMYLLFVCLFVWIRRSGPTKCASTTFQTFPVILSFTPFQRWGCFVGLCYSKVDIKHLFSQLEKRKIYSAMEDYLNIYCLFVSTRWGSLAKLDSLALDLRSAVFQ